VRLLASASASVSALLSVLYYTIQHTHIVFIHTSMHIYAMRAILSVYSANIYRIIFIIYLPMISLLNTKIVHFLFCFVLFCCFALYVAGSHE
jgi:hypothetical protein